ncbi:MAG: NADH-quinone oxidoreductase subunit NuoK [Calditrichia bacterium]
MEIVPANHVLILSLILFFLGVFGVLTRRNAIVIFMSIELMLNAVNLAFITFSNVLHNIEGQMWVFMVMIVAAAEVAVGLAIIISIFRIKETIHVDDIKLMRW